MGNPEHIVLLLDPTDNFYKGIGGFAMPETVVYDIEGNISSHTRGSMTYEQMVERVEAALSAQTDS